MAKMTKVEAREKLRAAKKQYRNQALTFDQYVAIKRVCKEVLLDEYADER